MTKETQKWWEETSRYYQEDANIPVGIHYGPGAPFEDGKYGLKLLGNLKNKKVLELGCGGAQCGIAMAKKGAKVIGIDISEEQLKFAIKLAIKNKVKISLIQGDVKKFSKIKKNTQDLVFTAWALQYIDNLESCFKESFRVLKKGGNFVLALPHPFSRTIDEKKLKVKQSYFITGKEERIEIFEDGTKHKFVIFNRTVSEIVNNLLNSGFFIEKIIEPDSRIHYPKDPWYGIWEFSKEFNDNIPQTLIIKAKKLK